MRLCDSQHDEPGGFATTLGWRRLSAKLARADSKTFHLILDSGLSAELLGTELADGAPLAPRELAALVHDELTALIDQIRRLCLDRRRERADRGHAEVAGTRPQRV